MVRSNSFWKLDIISIVLTSIPHSVHSLLHQLGVLLHVYVDLHWLWSRCRWSTWAAIVRSWRGDENELCVPIYVQTTGVEK